MPDKIVIGVVVPTRGDRPLFLKHCKWLLARQRLQPDHICIVDYPPRDNKFDLIERYKYGFNKLFRNHHCHIVFLWEDDDWYSPDYIGLMMDEWMRAGKPDLFGIQETIYYNINLRKYNILRHEGRASAMSSMTTRAVLHIPLDRKDQVFMDYNMWLGLRAGSAQPGGIANKKAISFEKPICIGIKHGVGKCAGIGHRDSRHTRHLYHTNDRRGEYLAGLIDRKSYDLYAELGGWAKPVVNMANEFWMPPGATHPIRWSQWIDLDQKDWSDAKKMLYMVVGNKGKWQKSTMKSGQGIPNGILTTTPDLSPHLNLGVRDKSGRPLTKIPPEIPSGILSDKIPSGMTDIIIPTYENEDYTVNCIRSIQDCTKEGTYRIIWVDNGSDNTEKVIPVLRAINHIPVLLQSNEGFVGAINRGLAVSDAPFVCLLNNDTIVSDRWLEKLVSALDNDPKLGIIGALTGPPAILERYDSHHNIACQQKFRKVPVFPKYINLADFNRKIEKQLPGVVGNISFVAFLCAVLKRAVIDKVGHLDPNYDMGLYDDNDYNIAAEKAGFRIGLLLDTCIFHKGRTTFNMLEREKGFDTAALLRKNKRYLDNKWGIK